MRIPPGFHRKERRSGQTPGFTLVELLTVMTIIAILAALAVGMFQYAEQKGSRSRAEVEINAMQAALESYKADKGVYPSDANTDGFVLNPDPSSGKPTANLDPTGYTTVGRALYVALSGDADGKFSTGVIGEKMYFEFKPNQLGTTSDGYNYPVDPWGSGYGYSTAQATQSSASPASSATLGYNPTFDIWSTGGSTTDPAKWIKNW